MGGVAAIPGGKWGYVRGFDEDKAPNSAISLHDHHAPAQKHGGLWGFMGVGLVFSGGVLKGFLGEEVLDSYVIT